MRESGTALGLRFLYTLNRLLGRSVFSFILYFVSFYFVVTRREYRHASKQYLQQHSQYFPKQWPSAPSLRHTLRHFRAFGETILDKALAWSSDISEQNFHLLHPEHVHDTLNDKRGQLIIGTHLGNLEYCRGFMKKNPNKIINILVHDKHAANFAAVMQKVNPASRLNIFQVADMDVPMILTLKERIDNGEWLFIAGDRIPIHGHQRTVTVDFLGKPAAFPIGPYHLAKALACPVKLMFAYREHGKITVDLQPFSDKITIDRSNRNEQLQQFAQHFSTELEKRCAIVPYQWFNFYDFWAKPLKK